MRCLQTNTVSTGTSTPRGSPKPGAQHTHVELGWGVAPQVPDFFFTAFFPFFSFFFLHFIRCQFFFFFLHVVVVVIILFLKTNHIWSCFSADTGTRGGDEADTNMRQAGRAPRAAGLQTPTLSGETRRSPHCSGATGAPEQWKCTFCHLPSRRCHTRVSSDWLVRGRPWPSMYCVRRM